MHSMQSISSTVFTFGAIFTYEVLPFFTHTKSYTEK